MSIIISHRHTQADQPLFCIHAQNFHIDDIADGNDFHWILHELV